LTQLSKRGREGRGSKSKIGYLTRASLLLFLFFLFFRHYLLSFCFPLFIVVVVWLHSLSWYVSFIRNFLISICDNISFFDSISYIAYCMLFYQIVYCILLVLQHYFHLFYFELFFCTECMFCIMVFLQKSWWLTMILPKRHYGGSLWFGHVELWLSLIIFFYFILNYSFAQSACFVSWCFCRNHGGSPWFCQSGIMVAHRDLGMLNYGFL